MSGQVQVGAPAPRTPRTITPARAAADASGRVGRGDRRTIGSLAMTGPRSGAATARARARALARAPLSISIPLALGAVAALAGAARGEERGLLDAGPMLGAVGHDHAFIWASPPPADAADGGRAPTLEVVLDLPDAPARRFAFGPVAADGRGGATARLDGLAPSTVYPYKVTVDGESAPALEGRFRTAPPPGAGFRATFVPASCMDTKRDRVQPAWLRVRELEPDLLLLLGDNNYANSPRRPDQWRLHRAQRRVPTFADLARRTPVFATWDDHDYGANNSDGTMPGKEESLEIFRELFPGSGIGLPEAPGAFVKASWGDVDIFLLDGRTYRAPNFSWPSAKKTFLGAAQEAWLARELAASTATFKLVACGSTLAFNPRDGWALFPQARARFFDLVATVPGVICLAGDIHRSFLDRHDLRKRGGYVLYEAISSGIALGRDEQSFAALRIDTTLDDPEVTVVIYKLDGAGRVTTTEATTIQRSALEPARGDGRR